MIDSSQEGISYVLHMYDSCEIVITFWLLMEEHLRTHIGEGDLEEMTTQAHLVFERIICCDTDLLLP